MSKLDVLINLFEKEGRSKPSDQIIEDIQAIDKAVIGTREELENLLFDIEAKFRYSWDLGTEQSGGWFEGTKYAKFPDNDGKQYNDIETLIDIHRERYSKILEMINGQDIVDIEDGGVKSFERAKQKVDRRLAKGREPYCRDLSRVRLIVPGLQSMEKTYYSIFANSHPWRSMSIHNHYSINVRKKYITPFRGVNTVWCGEDENNERDVISTEIQLMTQRVRSIAYIDHPFNVSKSLQYPDDESRDYVYSLLAKASILDFQERFEM